MRKVKFTWLSNAELKYSNFEHCITRSNTILCFLWRKESGKYFVKYKKWRRVASDYENSLDMSWSAYFFPSKERLSRSVIRKILLKKGSYFVLYNQLLKKYYNTIVRNTSSLKFNKVISYLKEEDLEKVFWIIRLLMP